MKGRVNMTVLILLVTVGFTEELTWNTKMRATVCCQGSKQLLIWNFTEGENERVTELHWFFNEKTLICLESETTGLIVSDLYKGRVVRNGTAGILLKNVSFNDAGEYTLYVKLEEEKERNVQGINLTVVESPPDQCKPIIEKKHPKGIISCYTSCERSPLSLEWIINGTQDPVGTEPYFVVDSSWTSEQLFCCLRDFKCHDDDQFKFCTPNHISFTEDMHTVNQSIADTNHMVFTSMLIFLLITQMAVIVIAGFILKRRCGLCHKRHYTGTLAAKHRNEQELLEMSEPENLNTVGQCKKNLQQVNTVAVTTVAVEPTNSNTVGQCNEDLQQVHTVTSTTVASEPKYLNTKKQCNEELEDVHAAAATTGNKRLQSRRFGVSKVAEFGVSRRDYWKDCRTNPKEMEVYQRGDDKQENQRSAKTIKKPGLKPMYSYNRNGQFGTKETLWAYWKLGPFLKFHLYFLNNITHKMYSFIL